MINCIAADVEVTPNLFSITFVDLNDYLNKCNCNNEKGNPIPLVQKYTVKEIKKLLETIKRKQFVITDYDDSQLLNMYVYINDMRSKYIKVDDKNVPFRTDLYGFNILKYDNLMIAAFLMYFDRYDNTASLIKKLYEISKDIIRLQNENEFDKSLDIYRKYKLPYASVDVMKVYALNKVGASTDKNGNKSYFGKSLKQTSINLQWYELLEFRLPPISDKDRIYYMTNSRYKTMTNEELTFIIKPFDRYVIKEYLDEMLRYNLNDVFIVCEIVRLKIDEIRLRYSITNSYKVNVLSSSRSDIANKLVTKFYSEMSGLHKDQFVKLRTERTKISFSKVIFPHIKFKTKQLQDVLDYMKTVSITRTSKDAFTKEVDFYGTKYTLATGGIHSVDRPGVLKSTSEYTYIHFDINSYYPSIIIAYNVAPKHLNNSIFVKLVKFLRDTRVKAKHASNDEVVIEGIPNKIVAEVLKIVINSIYGKLGDENGFLYDRLAQMQVTINGQLMTMTLIEELELNGIHCVSANTDGIVVKLPNNKKEIFKEITERWKENNKMGADGEDYETYICRDINNYMVKQLNGKYEYKGALDPNMYINSLQKGYDSPIVAKAINDYFFKNISIMDTLMRSNNILDFCKTQNVAKKFHLEYTRIVNGEYNTVEYQRNTRYYVSNSGGILRKVDEDGHCESLAAGVYITPLNTLTDDPIESRNINYKYYYNECFKIINPIVLCITAKGKGKTLATKMGGMYNDLFDLEDE